MMLALARIQNRKPHASPFTRHRRRRDPLRRRCGGSDPADRAGFREDVGRRRVGRPAGLGRSGLVCQPRRFGSGHRGRRPQHRRRQRRQRPHPRRSGQAARRDQPAGLRRQWPPARRPPGGGLRERRRRRHRLSRRHGQQLRLRRPVHAPGSRPGRPVAPARTPHVRARTNLWLGTFG
ncbi:hypothetical protein CC_2949 [Caulobacter vibrioides CB15]|uniref:Uncharacterized protein n=1 Tax=Caulobacter vibrioides (strain ATCC 19089 / CIP 103742 / CB 15) TaxID=190650 RepID=Q9A494_CAUVC|nr:hypothetical protein CC_2949 [Caulobacter vibrioides CB15]